MPYVNIKIVRDGATPEQKGALITGATRLLVDVLNKNPETTVVIIDEIDPDNWGLAGQPVTTRRARRPMNREPVAIVSDRTITGDEPPTGEGGALDALIAFYRAFNHADLEGLANNWAPGDLPSMDNPLGGIRRGWPAIREGYERLFSGHATVRVEFFDFTSQGSDSFQLFVGRERGICQTPAGRIDLRIRTTRWFVHADGIWRQLHHHGSIEEPAVLADYQRAIVGAPLGVAK